MPRLSKSERRHEQDVRAARRELARWRLRELRRQLREVRSARPAQLRSVRQLCREGRALVRAEQAASRDRLRERLRQERIEAQQRWRDQRQEARQACAAAKVEVRRSGLTKLERSRAELVAERTRQRTEREITRARAVAEKRGRRATSIERLQESDDAVRRDIPAELMPVFERVKGQIRGSALRSRSEAFIEWAAENPDEVRAILYEQADREAEALARREATERAELAELRTVRPGRARVVTAEAPF